jgi:hypothetical protein
MPRKSSHIIELSNQEPKALEAHAHRGLPPFGLAIAAVDLARELPLLAGQRVKAGGDDDLPSAGRFRPDDYRAAGRGPRLGHSWRARAGWAGWTSPPAKARRSSDSFPEAGDGRKAAEAKAICATCQVQEPCLDQRCRAAEATAAAKLLDLSADFGLAV